MIPLKLSVRNFLCYRDDVPPLDLRGVHVACLCGANGHGKSALLDAMTWCLWGQARTGNRNHNSLIAYGETECRVELDFEARGQAYRAVRRRRRRAANQGQTQVDLFVLGDSDNPRPITANTINETSERIRNLVGMDYDTFVNSAFLLQGRSDEFTRKTPSERKEVLSSILGLSLYDSLQTAARAKRSEWQDAVSRNIGALDQTQSALDGIPDPAAPLEQIALRLDVLSTELGDATAVAREAAVSLDDLRRRQSELSNTQARIATLNNDIRQATANRQAIDQRISEARELTGRSDEIRAGVEALQSARNRLDRLESTRSQYDQLLRQRDGLAAVIDRERIALATEATQVEHRIRDDLLPAASRADQIAEQLATLAANETALAADHRALDAQAERVRVLSGRVAAAASDVERCVAEGRELRARQQDFDLTGGVDHLCPLCRTPLSQDACGNIAEWYESEIAAKLQQHATLTADLAQLSQKHDRLAADTETRRQSLARRERQHQQERGRLEQQRVESVQARDAIEQLQPRLDALSRALESGQFCQKEREQLRAADVQLADLKYDDAEREQAYRQTQTLQPWEAQRVALEAAQNRLPQDEGELLNLEATLSRLTEEVAVAQGNLESDQAALSGLTAMEQEANRAQSAVAALSAERDDLLARQGRLQGDSERRDAYRQDIVRIEKDRATAQMEQGVYSDLFNAFGRGGVPAMLIDAAVPALENEANHLLGRMTDNRLAVKMETQRVTQGGSTTETLEILISDELGPRSYELFSGGEAFRINLALRIALSKVLSRRLGTPLPTLFIDEGFGTQDAAGRERIVDAIASIQDEFEKIIVITHLEELKDLFPTRIEVLKTEAGSQFWLS